MISIHVRDFDVDLTEYSDYAVDVGNAVFPGTPGLNGPFGNGNGDTVFRIREGIDRFLITDINNPNASAEGQASIPLTWEMPGGHDESGGWVLYMDGHVEWKGYPGDFPMNPAFIERIRGIMNSGR